MGQISSSLEQKALEAFKVGKPQDTNANNNGRNPEAMEPPSAKASSLAMEGRCGGLKRPLFPEPTGKPAETAAGKQPQFSAMYKSKEALGTVPSLRPNIGRETVLLKVTLLKDFCE